MFSSPLNHVMKMPAFKYIRWLVVSAFLAITGVGGLYAAGTLAVGNGFSGQISAEGVLSTWGKNTDGQLGHSLGVSPVTQPTLVPGSWMKVAMGEDFTLGLDAAGRLFAWGNNSQSQLGTGSLTTNSVTPLPVAVPAGVAVVDFTTGYRHAVLLGSDGQLYAWGFNGLGQLGTGDTSNRSTPTKIVFKGLDKKKKPIVLNMAFSSVVSTDNSILAVATDGSLWAWGSNSSGELGTGSKSFINSSPAMVGKSKGWNGLSTGSRHVVGILGGKVYTWGDNSMGQLGAGKQGGAVNKPAAIKFKMPKGQKAPALVRYVAGGVQTFGLTADGTLYAWGSNQMGQLGIASGSVLLAPTLVSASERYELVESSSFSTLLKTTAGSATPSALLAVGSNINGELGNGVVENTRGTGVSVKPKVNVANLAVSAPALQSEFKNADGLNVYGLGGTFGNLPLVVQNKGTMAHTAAYTVSYYLSTDATLDAGDRLLATRTESSALSAGATRGTLFTAGDLLIPQVVPGIYYLLSQVVSSNQSDGFSPDNGASMAVELQSSDFAVSSSNLRLSPDSAGLLPNFTTLLRNVGIGQVSVGTKIGYRVFLSADSNLSPDDIDLTGGVDATYSVQSGDFVFDRVFVPVLHSGYKLPSNLPAGTYKIFVVYNRNAALPESNLENNTVALTVTMATADLAVSSPVASSSSVGSNSILSSVLTFVQNRGASNYSSTYQVSLYLSKDSVYSSDDIVIASSTESAAILSGGSRQVTFANIAIPDLAAGDYKLLARVQVAASETDADNANNISSSDLTLGDPSLTLDSFVFPNTTSIDRGGSLGAVSYRLRNTGAGGIASGRNILMQVWLSTDSTFSSGTDVLVDQYSYTSGLSAGASVVLPANSHTLTLPTGLNNGIYNLLFIPTLTGTVNSPDVVYGTVAKVISVGVLNVSVAAPVLPGTSPVTLGVNSVLPNTTISVNNKGGFSVPSGGLVKLWLSSDSTLDTSDVLLGTSTISGTISAGGTRSIGFSNIVVPDIGQGTYYLISELILPDGLLDVDLTDNQASILVNLVRPSLEVKNLNGVPNEVNLDSTKDINSVSFDLYNASAAVIPAGVSIAYEVYLSQDNQVSTSTDSRLHSGTWTSGITAGSTISVAPFNLKVPDNTVGGNYYLIFVANRDATLVLGTEDQSPKIVRQIRLNKVDAPGAALDYGFVTFGGTGSWQTVTDSAASNSEAWQSPVLALGQNASISLDVYGPTVLRVPWKVLSAPLISPPTVTGALDSISYATSPVSSTVTLDAAQSSDAYRMPNDVPIVVDAPSVPGVATRVTWTYAQNSSYVNGYARLDLDLPSYTTSGDGSWTGITDATAKVGTTVAKSPVLTAGQQASLELNVTGPALVKFWWKSTSVANTDVLSFSVDGVLAQLPTSTYTQTASPAMLSGTQDWQQVAFLIGDGPRTLRWTYVQGSTNAASTTYLDGLEILSVLDSKNQVLAPEVNALNRSNDSDGSGALGDRQNVPISNVDLAIKSVVAAKATYLLDDANGTSRLPLNVLITSDGYDFSANPSWSSSNMQVRLSTNATYGDADDLILGDFQQFSSIPHERQLTLNADINLPFNIPSGNYYLFVRVMGASGVEEFTLANNTYSAGNGYIIKRAPNLVVDDYIGLAAQFPYHPEDSVYISYALKNTGLGSVLPSQSFKVRLTLMARTLEQMDITKGIVIKDYPDNSYALFLPEVGGQYPLGGTYDVVQSLSLPNTRDILFKLGSVNATDPEDSAPVYAKLGDLRKYIYYFKVFVDVDNAISESSETNVFYFGDSFHVVPMAPYDAVSQVMTDTTTFGQFIGDSAFEGFFSDDSYLSNTSTSDAPFAARVRDYALYRAPFAQGKHSNTTTVTATAGSPSGLLTSSASLFESGDVGKLFRMDSGEVFNINAFTTVTQVNIAETTAAAGPSTGAIYDYGTPNLLFADEIQNSVRSDLNVPGFSGSSFLTISFDFNVLAKDVAIDVERSDDAGVTWAPLPLVTIAPPYIGTTGSSSLTGYLGLLDNPYVFAVEGNNTDVQKTYAARVSVRDQLPYTSAQQRLRLSVRSLVSKPAELTVLSPSAGFDTAAGEAGVLLDWSNGGANPSTGGDYVYIIERKGGTTTDYKVLGWSFSPNYYDKSASDSVGYTYRVKAVSSGGATAYLPEVTGGW
ncbi:MAG: hypothetical protein NTU80_14295 [Verrucomicrobia bacterium]|nr:hypothetical protein [Verrucomicrobiota bacterium]